MRMDAFVRSPGRRCTFVNPFSSLTGRGSEDSRSLMYSCATSAPATVPVFTMSKVTVMLPLSGMVFAESFRFSYAKVV
jgi:hypothetical protein